MQEFSSRERPTWAFARVLSEDDGPQDTQLKSEEVTRKISNIYLLFHCMYMYIIKWTKYGWHHFLVQIQYINTVCLFNVLVRDYFYNYQRYKNMFQIKVLWHHGEHIMMIMIWPWDNVGVPCESHIKIFHCKLL